MGAVERAAADSVSVRASFFLFDLTNFWQDKQR